MLKVDEFDAVVIGTGFGGAVTACRLVEAGFRICILERGRRYGPGDFPKYPTGDLFAPQEDSADNYAPPPDFSRWLWSQDHGIYDIRDLDDAMSVQAAGYGGGSLIYANVHLRPPRKVFEHGWPEEYNREQDGEWNLTPYFDLAAYMLRVRPIPVKLAKTLRMQEAAAVLPGSPANHWFRTPLAVHFSAPGEADGPRKNDFGRDQQTCDMRGRCWQGCDRQAKNTLDLNYLARAEDGDPKPDIRTLAEVTGIDCDDQGIFTVTYTDLLLRGDDEWRAKLTGDREVQVRARYVFLCAGSVHTTELLLKNPRLWGIHREKSARDTPVGSHYFPNADSFSVVFDCKTAHEADYGPTITSALLYQEPVKAGVHCSLDFHDGFCRSEASAAPAAGTTVRGILSGATAVLFDAPILDWGGWRRSATGAAGALVLSDQQGTFAAGEPLQFGSGGATAVARSAAIDHEHWFVAEDGGYPPDLAPLVNVFRSPLWLRRNRFLEPLATPRPRVPPLRPTAQHLRVQAFVDALGGTSRRAVSSEGLLARRYNSNGPRRTSTDAAGGGQARLGNLPEIPVRTLFPEWFVTAIKNDRQELFEQAATFALPLLSRLLDDLSKTLSTQIGAEQLAALGVSAVDRGPEKDVLIRGMFRQVLQVIAGSEVAIANKVASLLIEWLPGNSEGLLKALGDLMLWALAYGSNEGHTGLILTMGRDLYRGKLDLVHDGRDARTVRLRARLSSRLLDTSSVAQERVLRAIATQWEGELRTNPTWATFGQRVTVHSQGGCPMGSTPQHSVTAPNGEVHGCPGLYVMDAAAFPTSVGVNPSATIAAVAEYKIEQFIRARRRDDWAAGDRKEARKWVETHGRAQIDPLDLPPHASEAPKTAAVLGMTFEEKMEGFLWKIGDEPIDWEDLTGFPPHIHHLVQAEDAGVDRGLRITMKLEARVPDLGQHIARGSTTNPMKIDVKGTVGVGRMPERNRRPVIEKESYLQFFVRPADDTTPPVRFFRYKICFKGQSHDWEINGLKVLRDQPGFDVWQDTSSLYFELSGGDGRRRGGRRRRSGAQRRGGVMRLSANDFITDQLTSMTITGTKDPARCSWALAAFYKYFIGELVTVYGSRVDGLKHSLWKVMTEIHV